MYVEMLGGRVEEEMSRKIMCKGKMSKGKNCRKKRSIRIIRREKK